MSANVNSVDTETTATDVAKQIEGSDELDIKGLSPKEIELVKKLNMTNSEAKSYRLKAKELEEKLTALETEKQKVLEKELSGQQKYKELAELKEKELSEIKPLLKRLEEFEAKEIERKKELLKKLPETLQKVMKDDSIEKIQTILDSLGTNPTSFGTVQNPISSLTQGALTQEKLLEQIRNKRGY